MTASCANGAAQPMDATNKPCQIVLVGSMGAGKTALGKRLAEHLNYHFLDVDQQIVRQVGCDIPSYFQRYGESAFRSMEQQVVKQTLSAAPADDLGRVVALGGGSWQSPATRDIAARFALSVWLDVEPEVLWQRVSRHLERRPMLHGDNPKARLLELIEARAQYFQQANVRVALGEQSLRAGVDKILEAIRHHQAKG